MRTPTFLPLLALMLAGCGGGALEATASFATSPVAPASPSSSVRAVASNAASPSSTPAPSLTPSNATPLPTPFGATVFADPDSCTNPELGYRVAYPDSWYSNAAMANPLNPGGVGIAACWLFAPTDFAVVYGTEIPVEVAVVIRAFEWPEGSVYEYAPPRNARIVSDSTTTVAGLPARYQELEITERDIAYQVGDRIARYVVQVTERKYLTAQTYRGPDYSTAKTVLDQLVLTLELLAP